MVNLDRCNRSCNTFDDPSGRICIPNKMDNANINVFNMITRINELKTLTKDIYFVFYSNIYTKSNNAKMHTTVPQQHIFSPVGGIKMLKYIANVNK